MNCLTVPGVHPGSPSRPRGQIQVRCARAGVGTGATLGHRCGSSAGTAALPWLGWGAVRYCREHGQVWVPRRVTGLRGLRGQGAGTGRWVEPGLPAHC